MPFSDLEHFPFDERRAAETPATGSGSAAPPNEAPPASRDARIFKDGDGVTWWVHEVAGEHLGILVQIWNGYLNTADGLIEERHFHDIGKLIFAFTAFWGYLTFGQYLVIWYGNMGEETFFMRLRLMQPWVWITVTSVILVFVMPFFGLLSRAAKVFRPTFLLFALCSVAGLWLMRHIEVYPSKYGTTLTGGPFGPWEIGIALLYVGVWGWLYCAFMDAFPRMRVTLLTSPFRDEVQVPVDPETMEPLPAHE